MAIDLIKQQAPDVDPKSISFAGNLDWDRNTTMFFIIE